MNTHYNSTYRIKATQTVAIFDFIYLALTVNENERKAKIKQKRKAKKPGNEERREKMMPLYTLHF